MLCTFLLFHVNLSLSSGLIWLFTWYKSHSGFSLCGTLTLMQRSQWVLKSQGCLILSRYHNTEVLVVKPVVLFGKLRKTRSCDMVAQRLCFNEAYRCLLFKARDNHQCLNKFKIISASAHFIMQFPLTPSVTHIIKRRCVDKIEDLHASWK